MKRILLTMFVGVFTALTIQAQIVHTDNVEIEKSDGAKLDMTHTGINKTWRLISGLSGGFQIGYLTGGLTGNTAPFIIKENGYIGMLMTSPNDILDPLTVNGNIRIFDSNAGIKLGSEPFISAPSSNTFLGVEAGRNNTTGIKNLFAGYRAGKSNTTGFENLFLGNSAGEANVDGNYNTFIGRSAGTNNVGGDKNMFLGRSSGQNNVSGSDNIYVGFFAGMSAKGSQNVLIGSESGMGNTTATGNTYVGHATGKGNLNNTGQNTFIGMLAGTSSTGSKNVALGYRAGEDTDGEKNVFIGYNAGVGVTAGSNRLYIGNDQASTNAGKLIYGEFDNGKVGINTDNLDANSALTVGGGLKTEGDITLTSGFGIVQGSDPLLSAVATNTFLGLRAGKNTTSSNNTFMGRDAGMANTSGNQNTLVGYYAGVNNLTGFANTFMGSESGRFNTTGTENTFIGGSSGRNNTVGIRNAFVGLNSGRTNTTGSYNAFFGYNSGGSNLTGGYNMFIGRQAGYGNTSGSRNAYIGSAAGAANNGDYNVFIGDGAGSVGALTNKNVAIGYQAGRLNNASSGGNTFIGTESGNNNTTGEDNVAIGYRSGRGFEGVKNVAIGMNAGADNTSTGSYNVFLGHEAGLEAGNDSERLYIANRRVSQRTALIYGEFDNGKVGINTTTLEANSALTVGGKIAATEYLLADGSPLLSAIASSPWTSNAADITFDTGKVGIGTTTPDAMLHIKDGASGGTAHDFSKLTVEGSDKSMITILTPNDKIGYYGFSDSDDDFVGGMIYNHGVNRMNFKVNSLATPAMSIDNAGFVGIGTNSPQEKLEVAGNTLIQGDLEVMKVVVTATPGQGWPDYVFEPEFRLRPLSEVEAFVKNNKHLPEVPSAKEVEANGIDLGNMDATLLKKVEELTLYMIEMNKKIEKLEEENKQLKELVKKDK